MEITRLLATRQLPDLMIKSSAADLPVKPETESALEGRETSHSPVKLTLSPQKATIFADRLILITPTTSPSLRAVDWLKERPLLRLHDDRGRGLNAQIDCFLHVNGPFIDSTDR